MGIKVPVLAPAGDRRVVNELLRTELYHLSGGNNYSALLMWLLGSRKYNKLSKAPSRVLWYIADAQQIIVITM